MTNAHNTHILTTMSMVHLVLHPPPQNVVIVQTHHQQTIIGNKIY